jgi:type I restriction enzyme S subunit
MGVSVVSGQVKEVSVQYQVGYHSCDSEDSVESRACPPGYKQTEVGVIPVNWKVDILEKVSAFITKGSTPTTYGFSWEKDGVLFLRSECVSERGLDLSESMYVSEKAHRVLKRSEVRSGDILITITGNVGRSICLDEKVVEGNINQHIARVRIISGDINSTYVFHYLSQRAVRKYFQSITTGQAYPQISLTQVRNTEIPYPSLKEQTAIANALSDVDALITSLGKLITKKRAIKTAAMQQLLTGKKRLPPFDLIHTGYKQTELGEIPEDWEVATLNNLCPIMTGNTPSTSQSKYYGDEYLFVSPADLQGQKYVTCTSKLLSKKGFSICRKYPKHSILFTCIGSTIGKCGMASKKLTSNQQINAVLPSEKIEMDYLYYQLLYTAPRVKQQAGEQAVPIVNKTQFGEHLVLVPNDGNEQKAISKALSDIDEEIERLEQRLNKTQQLKQGMMQELLTGRTRLI